MPQPPLPQENPPGLAEPMELPSSTEQQKVEARRSVLELPQDSQSISSRLLIGDIASKAAPQLLHVYS